MFFNNSEQGYGQGALIRGHWEGSSKVYPENTADTEHFSASGETV